MPKKIVYYKIVIFFNIAIALVVALFCLIVKIAITIKIVIKKRSKELILKIKQRRLRTITLQEAIKKFKKKSTI